MKNAGPVRQVRRALSRQVGKQKKAIATGRHGANLFFELRIVPAERLADMLGDKREVQRADQRQPIVRAVAKGGHFALRIDDWHRGKGEERSRCSEACGHHAGLDIAGSDGGHHVVAAARADRRRLGKAPFLAELLAQGSVGKLLRT